MGVVLSLKPILKNWQLCLSFKLDVLTTWAHTTERNIDHEFFVGSSNLDSCHVIDYVMFVCMIHYVIHACFVSHVTHSCLFLCGIHCYFECSSNSISFASYYNRLWAQTRLSERSISLVVRVRSRLKVTGTMAEGKTVSIIPLNGKNYPSWRVQCRMALMREGLWGIVAGTEQAPDETAGADERAKFSARSDRALATVVLAVDPSLLYLIGEPVDPTVVWQKLAGQFQKKTWANKLCLRKRLFTMKLSDAGTVREYIKGMTETFDELSAIGDPTTDEDKVVYLLAGLPESYDVLVTALESGTDAVPSMETVTERLLREEQKLKDREDTDDSKKLLVARYKKQSGPFTCHYCKKPGHFKKDCRKFLQARSNENHENRRQMPHQPRKKSHAQQDTMLISHALAATSKNEWIIDSGASSHMCNEQSNFKEFVQLQSTEKVALGDGSTLDVKGEGTIDMEMILQDGTRRVCVLNNVLYVPNLAYNLVSVSRATDAGKTVDFDDSTCEFRNEEDEVIAFGSRRGTLYFLKCTVKSRECANVTQENTKRLWHRRFGHLCEQSMMNLVKNDLVSKLNCDLLGEVGTCEACVGGKQCKSSFRSSESV